MLAIQKNQLEQTVDDLEDLYSNDLERLTFRLSEKDQIIRDLEGKLFELEQIRIELEKWIFFF